MPDMTKEGTERVLTFLFIGLQSFGLFAALLTLLTARFSPVSRQAPWYNFIWSWSVFCFSYLLLVLGGTIYDPHPPSGFCLTLYALTHATPAFAASTSLSLVLSLYMNVRAGANPRPNGAGSSGSDWSLLLIVVPYLVLVGVLLEALAIDLSEPRNMYTYLPHCSLVNRIPGRITAALVIIASLSVIILNVVIYSHIKKQSDALQTSRAHKSLFIRVTVFTFFGIITMVAGLLFFFVVSTKDRDMGYVMLQFVLAIIPPPTVLIFATHQDLLVVWVTLFRRCTTNGQLRESQAKTGHTWPTSP